MGEPGILYGRGPVHIHGLPGLLQLWLQPIVEATYVAISGIRFTARILYLI